MWKEARAGYLAVSGTFLLKNRKYVEARKEILVQNGVCVLLKQLAEEVERAEAALTIEKLFNGVLAGLRVEKKAGVICKVRKRMNARE